MKKTKILLLILTTLFLLTSCINPTGPIRSESSTEPIINSVPLNGIEKLKVNGFKDATSFNATFGALGSNSAVDWDEDHPFQKFVYASYFRYPWYINENAAKERELYIGENLYKLKYDRTIITENTIADQYLYEKDANIKIRYYADTDVLAEVVGLKLVEAQGYYLSIFSEIDEITGIKADYSTEQGMFDYSEKIAKLFKFEVAGLVPSSITHYSGAYPNSVFHACYEYVTDGKNGKYQMYPETDILSRAVVWSKVYDDGTIAPMFYVQYGVSVAGVGLQRIQFIPQVPDEVFSLTDEEVMKIGFETQYANTSFEEWSAKYKLIDRSYEIVCNNVISMSVVLEKKSANNYVEYYRFRIFPDGVVFPETPNEIYRPLTTRFPDGVYWDWESYQTQKLKWPDADYIIK